MKIRYRDLNENYLFLEIYDNKWKYGIVNRQTGEEYIPPVCSNIQYYKNANLIVLSFDSQKVLFHLRDLDNYVETLKIENEDLPF